jgi:hypothetical protein
MADKLPFNGPVELNGATTIAGATTISGATTATGTFQVHEKALTPNVTANTNPADGATLAVNSINVITTQNDATFNMPPVANCVKGDVVIVKYGVDLNDGQAHTYDTDANRFGTHSTLLKALHGVDFKMKFSAVAAPGSNADQLIITGVTDGGIGNGSHMTFAFDGTHWYVHSGILYHRPGGTGATEINAVFS